MNTDSIPQSLPARLQNLLILLVLSVLVASCVSVEPDIVGLGTDSYTQADRDQATIRRVFVATTRQRSSNPQVFFSGERSQQLTLGYMDVSIPAAHEPGKIERPRTDKIDPKRHFVLFEPSLTTENAEFVGQINQSLARLPAGERSVLVFIHGYNVNFSDAVLTVAQFVHDTGYEGVPVLFSWASRGRLVDYVYDLNSALQARNSLQRLGQIMSNVTTDYYDVVAHSMGSLLTLEAMSSADRANRPENVSALRHVILASPDIDLNLFETQLSRIPDFRDRITVLVSDDDRALQISRNIAGGVSRVGAADPVKLAELGLRVIDLSDISDGGRLGHSKFASSPDIVALIGRGIQQGNSLSAQATPSAVETIVGGVFQGITIIPASIVDGTRAAVLTVGN